VSLTKKSFVGEVFFLLGQKLHSWQYKTHRDFEDKTILIVGLGNSAGDMAVELGRLAKQVCCY
jgi:cation diffusion facilitator CzcD-associated flavoprotein CzcO